MKRLMKRTIEIILIIIIIGVSIILIVKWNQEERSLNIKAKAPKQEAEVNKSSGEEVVSVSPEEIAILFGWKKKAAVKKEKEVKEEVSVTEVEEPIEIKSLEKMKHLGHIVTSNGEEFYFFKDIETGELIRLSIDSPEKGWRLEEIVEKGFILGHDDKKYFVKRNE